MKITYGTAKENIDVTDICLSKLKFNNIILIPSGDNARARYFTDPLIGTHKSLFVHINNDKIYEFDEYQQVNIDITNNIITSNKLNNNDINNNDINNNNKNNKLNNNDINNNISKIHRNLKLKYGSFNDELPEQKMSVRYLKGTEKVLEIGGNIGRNSLVISHIIGGNTNNMVVMECDSNISQQLEENRNLNNMSFNIENSALSIRKLAQQGWNTVVCENGILPNNSYKWINTITYNELCQKYNIKFDTLVLDCEGAFYYILLDMPEILDNINLIIMENDYTNIEHYMYIYAKLQENKFVCEYRESGGWGPCLINFYEVWVKSPSN